MTHPRRLPVRSRCLAFAVCRVRSLVARVRHDDAAATTDTPTHRRTRSTRCRTASSDPLARTIGCRWSR